MKKLNNYRRNFLKNSGYLISSLLLSSIFKINISYAKSKLKPRIIIVGFGIGGATCISYLLKFSKILTLLLLKKMREYKLAPCQI